MKMIEIRSIVARVEDLTTAQWGLLMEDQTFKNMFALLVKGENPDIESISKRLADYANENIC